MALLGDTTRSATALARDRSELIFGDLFAQAQSRTEIVVTFLALLELIRLKRLKVRQESAFGEIHVIKVA